MALPAELVREFVKATNDSTSNIQNEKEYNATVTAVGDQIYVQLDGSDVITPVRSVIKVNVKDRVLVSIKDRTATIKSNFTSPAANTTDIASVNTLIAKKAGIEDLRAINASVDDLKAAQATIEEAVVHKAEVDDLNATNAEISKLKADKADVTDLNAANAEIGQLKTDKANVTDLNAANAEIEQLKTDKANVTDLNAANAEIGNLKTGKADIDFANVNIEAVTESWIKDLMVQGKVIAQNGTIYYLDAIHVNANYIDAGTLKADRILLHGDDGLYYQMNMDKLGSARIQAMTQEEQSQLRKTIHADLITAHSITTEQLTAENIQGTGGWINLAKGTFEYRNAKTGNGISWDGEHLLIQADSVVFSSGQSAEEMVQGAVDKVDNLEERMNSGEFKGEDATLLYIDSSRGTVFKNSAVSTILSVILYSGSKRITTAEEMKKVYGSGAYIQWSWQRLDEDRFGVISVDDPKIINDGFGLVLTPDDVDVKVTFSCELIM